MSSKVLEQWEAKRLQSVTKALTGITWNFDPGDIPNRAGHRFLALLRDGTHHWCQVVFADDGSYTIYGGLFPEIVAWRADQWEGKRLIEVSGGTTEPGPYKATWSAWTNEEL